MGDSTEELKASVRRLEAELADAKQKLFDAEAAASLWQVGDVIQTQKKGTFKVSRLASNYGRVIPIGLRQLKSGKWGAGKKLYSWDLECARKVGHEGPEPLT